MDAGLELALAATFGDFHLEVELALQPAETAVLVGPSGSGKTSLLRALAGLLRPDHGHIRLGGRVLLDTAARIDLPPWERRVGVVFQDYALFPHLTVEENVRYGLRGRPDAARRADVWLEALEIAELARRKPRELSGGQQQRVALARAAATDCELLLLDEPFGALDAVTRRSVRGELRRFLARAHEEGDARGRIALVITHDYLDALTLGDRIIVLEEGRVTQNGPRAEVLRNPRTTYLAELSGHNVLEGELLPNPDAGDVRQVRVGALSFTVATADTIPSGSVFLSFGPQEVSLFRPGHLRPDGVSVRNQFLARVQEIVSLPDRLRVYLDAGAPITAEIVRCAAADLGLAEGATVVAAIKSTAIEVYR